MARKATPGSISSGTMLNEDLIPSFMDELESLRPSQARKLTAEYGYDAEEFDFESEDADYLLESLFDALDNLAPMFCYFGAHPGDGADYGFWVADGSWEDYLSWSDDTRNPTRSELGDYPGYYRVSDHGNITIYARNYREIAAFV